MDTHLSWYGAASTQPSPVNRMMAAFTSTFRDGVDINLGVGFVNEQTIPIARLEQAMHAVAADPVTYRQAFNYGSATGTANLIASIRRFLLRTRLGQLDAATLNRNRLIVGPCGATSLLDALAQVLKQGIVITSDPAYYIYADALERQGFEVLAVPEDSEGISLEALERKLRELGDRVDEISFFYVVTVNNPSCTILSNARRRALYNVAARLSRRQTRRIPIFFDLAYEWLLHDPRVEPLTSVLPQDDLEIAYEIGTLSKVIAPALRIGYLLGPDGPFLHAMIQKTSDTGFSAPPFVQEMAAYLLEHGIEDQLRDVNAGYRAKSLAVRAGIEQHLGPFLANCRGGSAGFYFYLTMREVETHPASQFFRALTEAPGERPRIIYIPGEYCVHPRGDLAAIGRRQLRLSYGFESADAILRALALMREAIPQESGTLVGL
jgi:DNA-binding transcriptional MocR family regulator